MMNMPRVPGGRARRRALGAVVLGAAMAGSLGVAQAIDAPYEAPLPPATTFYWEKEDGNEKVKKVKKVKKEPKVTVSHHTIQLTNIVKVPESGDYWWEYAVNQKIGESKGEIKRWGLGTCRNVASQPEWMPGPTMDPPWVDALDGLPMNWWSGNAPYSNLTMQPKGKGSGQWEDGVRLFRVLVDGAWAIDTSNMYSAIEGTSAGQPNGVERLLAAPGCNGLVDLGITKTVTSAATVEPGGTVSYTVTVTNNGWWDIPWDSLKVSDPGAELSPNAAFPTSLPVDASFSWTATKAIPASIDACGPVSNTASVSVVPAGLPLTKAQRKRLAKMSKAQRTAFLKRLKKVPNGVAQAAPTGFIDPVPGNNSATAAGVTVAGGICETVTAAGTPVVGLRPASAGLEVSKTGTARVVAGGNVVYRITVTNTGGADATGVVLNETPPGTLVWRAVPAGATRSGRNVSWNIGTLTAGQSVTKTVSFKMRRTATGRSCNVASATSTNAGSARDRACTTVSVARRPATPVTG